MTFEEWYAEYKVSEKSIVDLQCKLSIEEYNAACTKLQNFTRMAWQDGYNIGYEEGYEEMLNK